jgi:serine/threonine protein kinase
VSVPRDELEGLVGQTIAHKYLLQRLIGAGGMGAVYEAKNLATHGRFALKLMLASLAHRGDQVERFFREARASARIQHPNIVQVFDVGQGDDGVFFIVQEFLQGRDLRALLDERGTLPPHEALTLLAPVMSALATAHAQGVVHRDIKPDNIFIAQLATGERTAKIIDFGIAKLSEAGTENLSVTRTGAAIGTPLYMSPEQARGDRSIDGQTDIWSLGVVLYEALSGRTPFAGESYNAVLAKILTMVPPRLDTVVPDLHPAIADVVARALAPSRGERYQTMDEFLAAATDVVGWESDRPHTFVGRSSAVHPGPERGATDAAYARTVEESAALSGPSAKAPSEDDGASPAPPFAAPAVISAVPTPSNRRGSFAAAVAAVALVGVVGAIATRSGNASRQHTDSSVASPTGRRRGPQQGPSPAVSEVPQSNGGTAAHPVGSSDASATGELMLALTASPPNAIIEVDGRRAVGAFAGRIVCDGSPHQVRVYAPGYVSRELTFVDRAPEGRIVLDRLAGTGTPARRDGTGAGTTVPREPAGARSTTRSGPMQREYE